MSPNIFLTLSYYLNFALGKSFIKRCEDQLLLGRSFGNSLSLIRVAHSCAQIICRRMKTSQFFPLLTRLLRRSSKQCCTQILCYSATFGTLGLSVDPSLAAASWADSITPFPNVIFCGVGTDNLLPLGKSSCCPASLVSWYVVRLKTNGEKRLVDGFNPVKLTDS